MAKSIEYRATQRMLCDVLRLPVAAGAEIYGGTLTVFDTEKGGCTPAANRRHTVSVGVSLATASATGRFLPTDVPKVALVRSGQFFFEAAHPMSNKDLLRRVYAVDDQTVATSDFGSEGPWVGNLIGIEGNGVWIEIDNAVRECRRD